MSVSSKLERRKDKWKEMEAMKGKQRERTERTGGDSKTERIGRRDRNDYAPLLIRTLPTPRIPLGEGIGGASGGQRRCWGSSSSSRWNSTETRSTRRNSNSRTAPLDSTYCCARRDLRPKDVGMGAVCCCTTDVEVTRVTGTAAGAGTPAARAAAATAAWGAEERPRARRMRPSRRRRAAPILVVPSLILRSWRGSRIPHRGVLRGVLRGCLLPLCVPPGELVGYRLLSGSVDSLGGFPYRGLRLLLSTRMWV
ncbi:hypothetical protein B0H17DRAFT_1283923 [Mycena rosella]|uniref:Uncharacterized protein n=1 Tax=Mycena rosella TaxID=1033263 RepID=A0AAD7BT63_MYCRO|nr:hypothetical protein B0H17DRAFT_1283923 [Mycena rosella]